MSVLVPTYYVDRVLTVPQLLALDNVPFLLLDSVDIGSYNLIRSFSYRCSNLNLSNFGDFSINYCNLFQLSYVSMGNQRSFSDLWFNPGVSNADPIVNLAGLGVFFKSSSLVEDGGGTEPVFFRIEYSVLPVF
jgi:hypothetical protein